MTKDEISKIKEHIEIHARREPRAVKITEIMRKAVDELERIAELESQIEKMKCCENCAWWYKLPNGQRDCAETCENRDNWSLRR